MRRTQRTNFVLPVAIREFEMGDGQAADASRVVGLAPQSRCGDCVFRVAHIHGYLLARLNFLLAEFRGIAQANSASIRPAATFTELLLFSLPHFRQLVDLSA